MLELIALPHLPGHSIVIGLFTQVQNAGGLRQQLLDGNADFEYAFLDASIIASRKQVLAACFRALNDSQQQRLKTRNVHSEIVLALSPNNNIVESFRRFGISDNTKHIIAVKIGADLSFVRQHLRKHIDGDESSLTDEALSPLRDVARIRKIYRLGAGPNTSAATLDVADEAFILGSMALRGS